MISYLKSALLIEIICSIWAKTHREKWLNFSCSEAGAPGENNLLQIPINRRINVIAVSNFSKNEKSQAVTCRQKFLTVAGSIRTRNDKRAFTSSFGHPSYFGGGIFDESRHVKPQKIALC